MTKTHKIQPLTPRPFNTIVPDKHEASAKMRPTTPDLVFARPVGPSSPPETPTTSSFTFGTSPRPPRRNGANSFSHPLTTPNGLREDKDSLGQGRPAIYNPSMRHEDISPRSSSSSSASSSRSPPRSRSSSPDMPEYVHQTTAMKGRRIVPEGNFTLVEIQDSDVQYDSDDALSVVRPDCYEDAESESARERQPNPTTTDLDTRILTNGLEKLNCNNHSDEREAWLKSERIRARRKRLSSGSIQKRTLSQSIGSDTDDEDLQQFDANEAGSSARRLRRRTGDLIFDDPPQMIAELEEPDSGIIVAPLQIAEPDVDNDIEELGLHSLPYYEMDTDSMEVDSESD